MSDKGKLFLIPVFLDEETETNNYLVPAIQEITSHIHNYIVENEKTARKFLKKAGSSIPQSDFVFKILEKKQHHIPNEWLNPILEGKDMGLMSEAGVPCMADPGAEVVKKCHELGIEVVPMVGASSIVMALMSSGMNGQSFVFHGYLPIDKDARIQKLKQIEKSATQYNQTQIFIETPYRNQQMLEDIVRHCQPTTRLHISCNITSKDAMNQTAIMEDWKNNTYDFHKKPAVFVVGR